ncbi:hypothetical protein ONZ45_g19521 [Pleurotus djamor]|nr:hypothetical protein ONZ45_g19521 [Pleurotus djamor]
MTHVDTPSAVDQHVFNEMPINVVRVYDMKLLSREDLQQETVQGITTMLQTASFDQMRDIQTRLEKNENIITAALLPIVRERTKYAILSHRWASHELDYATMKNLSNKTIPGLINRPGYFKVVRFAEKAKEYGCSYIWFDTGCINKMSSAEMEESIRSMFTWYRKAEICIVYLAQTAGKLNLVDKDAWFSRGWTLQELLAPLKMKFYSSNWMPITASLYDIDRTKPLESDTINMEFWNDLSAASGSYLLDAPHFRFDQIDPLTGIRPVESLHDFCPGIARARDVLHWASQRHTSRPEDMAYCLVGLLGLQLSIAYGEGHQTAFYRMQVELMQRSEDRGLFFWSGMRSPESSMLAATAAGFEDPVPWSKDGVRVDRHHAECLDLDPTISMTNCGIRMTIPKFPVTLASVTSSYETDAGRVYALSLKVQDLCCVANVNVLLASEPESVTTLIADTWSIGLLGSAFITHQGYPTFLPILLERTSGKASQRYRRLFTDRFLLDINIEEAGLTLKNPEVIYVK